VQIVIPGSFQLPARAPSLAAKGEIKLPSNTNKNKEHLPPVILIYIGTGCQSIL
jgi:hypothetical protein